MYSLHSIHKLSSNLFSEFINLIGMCIAHLTECFHFIFERIWLCGDFLGKNFEHFLWFQIFPGTSRLDVNYDNFVWHSHMASRNSFHINILFKLFCYYPSTGWLMLLFWGVKKRTALRKCSNYLNFFFPLEHLTK